MSCKSIFLIRKDDEVHESNKRFEMLLSEFEHFKSDHLEEIERLIKSHNIEKRELMSEIGILAERADKKEEVETLTETRAELFSYKKRYTDLQNEITILRREKESLLVEKNEVKLEMMKENDNLRMKTKLTQTDLDKVQLQYKNLEHETIMLRNKVEAKAEELRLAKIDNLDLVRVNRERENDFNGFKAQILILHQKVEERDLEISEGFRETNSKEQERYMKNRHEMESYQQKIEDLTSALQELRIKYDNNQEKHMQEMKDLKKDYYALEEEKRILIQKLSNLEVERDEYRRGVSNSNENDLILKQNLEELDHKVREGNSREAQLVEMIREIEKKLHEKEHLIEQFEKHLIERKDPSSERMAEKIKQLEQDKSKYKKRYAELAEKVKRALTKRKQNKEEIDEDEMYELLD